MNNPVSSPQALDGLEPDDIYVGPIIFPPDPAVCQHKEFSVHFEMGKTEGGLVARVQVWCKDCGQPFAFTGVSGTDSDVRPHVAQDGTQIHLPLACHYGPAVVVP